MKKEMRKRKPKACGNWVVLTLTKEESESGFLIEKTNAGRIESKGEYCSNDYMVGEIVYFNKRNAVQIEDYFIVQSSDIYMVI
jgi:co-chaperonin GroES (HSP10)